MMALGGFLTLGDVASPAVLRRNDGGDGTAEVGKGVDITGVSLMAFVAADADGGVFGVGRLLRNDGGLLRMALVTRLTFGAQRCRALLAGCFTGRRLGERGNRGESDQH